MTAPCRHSCCFWQACFGSSSEGEQGYRELCPELGMQPSGKETGSVYTQIPVQPAALARENRKGHDSYIGFSLNIKWSEVFLECARAAVCLAARRNQVGEPGSRGAALPAQEPQHRGPSCTTSMSCPITAVARREELTLVGISVGEGEGKELINPSRAWLAPIAGSRHIPACGLCTPFCQL